MGIKLDWKAVVSNVAPVLATALGGPLAGVAVKAVASGLTGKPDASDAEIAAAVTSPDGLLKLREIELQFEKDMAAMGVDLEKIAAEDRNSARQREVQVRDHTPALMAYAVTIGFFGTLAYLLVHGKPEMGGDALLVMLGSLGTAWTAIISYFYGSSAGSKDKTAALAGMAKR